MIPLLALLLSPPATAAAPTAEVGVFGAVGGEDPVAAEAGVVEGDVGPTRTATGLSLGAGLVLSDRFQVGLAGEGGLSLRQAAGAGASPWIAARPVLRAYLSPARSTAGALSVEAGAGALLAARSDTPALDVVGGLSLDLPGRGALAPRISLLARTDGQGHGGAALRIGLSLPRLRTPPPPPPPPPDRWVWVPHPVRECMLESRVRSELLVPSDPREDDRRRADPDDAPPPNPWGLDAPLEAVTRDAPLDLEAMFRPTQGTLVVIADPHDDVVVDGHVIPVGPDGTAVLTAPEGPVPVTVRSAGRAAALQPAVAAGYATWVRHEPDTSSHLVVFELDRAELDEGDRAQIRDLAANAGDWAFELRGQYSPEGTVERNMRLAGDRALVVHQALVEAGVPQDRLFILPIEDASAEGDVERMRSCRVIPVPPQGP